MRIREIDVAAPYPLAAITFFRSDEPGRLRIVNDEQVLDELHALPVLLVVHQEDVEDLFGRMIVAAMQRVVKALGHFKEVVAAGDDLPFGLDFQLLHQGNQAVQDLSDPSTHGGGVHHLHGLAAQQTRDVTDLVYFGLPDDGGVVVQPGRRWRRRRRLGHFIFAALANRRGSRLSVAALDHRILGLGLHAAQRLGCIGSRNLLVLLRHSSSL